MALLEPAHELPHRAVGFLFGRVIIRFVRAIPEPYCHNPPGNHTARATQAPKTAAKTARQLERQVRIESRRPDETRQC